MLYHLTELEAGKLKGEIELDKAYFVGKRKGKRGTSCGGGNCRFWVPGAGWACLYQSRGIGQCGSIDPISSRQNLQKFRLFHGCFSRVSILKTVWQTPYSESYEMVCGSPTKNHINGIVGF